MRSGREWRAECGSECRRELEHVETEPPLEEVTGLEQRDLWKHAPDGSQRFDGASTSPAKAQEALFERAASGRQVGDRLNAFLFAQMHGVFPTID